MSVMSEDVCALFDCSTDQRVLNDKFAFRNFEFLSFNIIIEFIYNQTESKNIIISVCTLAFKDISIFVCYVPI